MGIFSMTLYKSIHIMTKSQNLTAVEKNGKLDKLLRKSIVPFMIFSLYLIFRFVM